MFTAPFLPKVHVWLNSDTLHILCFFIKCYSSIEFVDYLSQHSFTHIILQTGKTDIDLTPLENAAKKMNITVHWFTFTTNFAPFVESSSLVISHAGAGSIIETLRTSNAHLLVVINEELMDNHQAELAEELEKQQYIYSSTPSNVIKTLQEAQWDSRKPYPSPMKNAFLALVAQTINYTSSSPSTDKDKPE